MNDKLRTLLQKMASSSNPFFKTTATFLRFPVKNFQLRLLYIRKNRNHINLIKKIQKEKGFSMWPDEMIFIYTCASLATKLEGDFAEVGVYKGASAKLICEAKGEKYLHLFDTFEGLPIPSSFDQIFKKNQFSTGLDTVKKYLENYQNIFFYKGVFPETSKPVEGKSFAFVHLDADLYVSTLECLNFFYPRMIKGGIIVSHDYSNVLGVKKAFTEYFTRKPELVIEMPTSQCLIVKT